MKIRQPAKSRKKTGVKNRPRWSRMRIEAAALSRRTNPQKKDRSGTRSRFVCRQSKPWRVRTDSVKLQKKKKMQWRWERANRSPADVFSPRLFANSVAYKQAARRVNAACDVIVCCPRPSEGAVTSARSPGANASARPTDRQTDRGASPCASDRRCERLRGPVLELHLKGWNSFWVFY